jgi:hypothetical protein
VRDLVETIEWWATHRCDHESGLNLRCDAEGDYNHFLEAASQAHEAVQRKLNAEKAKSADVQRLELSMPGWPAKASKE